MNEVLHALSLKLYADALDQVLGDLAIAAILIAIVWGIRTLWKIMKENN